jgi:FKBP-type peptidyl-prolyl cis-trans isomerase FklB
MTNKMTLFGAIALGLMACNSSAQNNKSGELKNEIDSVSYAIGMNVARNLQQQGMDNINGQAMVDAINAVLADDSISWDLAEAEAFLGASIKRMNEKMNEKTRLEGEAFLAENGKRAGVVTTASGLQYEVVEAGTGATPDNNDRVTVHYTGTLLDGTIFDSSRPKGMPSTFRANEVIYGWTEALQLMKEGGKINLWIPQNLGYGGRPAPGGGIPFFSMLTFELELLQVTPMD